MSEENPAHELEKRLARTGDRLGQWIEKAGEELEEGREVSVETWQRIQELALEVAAVAGELSGGGGPRTTN